MGERARVGNFDKVKSSVLVLCVTNLEKLVFSLSASKAEDISKVTCTLRTQRGHPSWGKIKALLICAVR
jgi:hypothetical protein